MDKRIRVAYLIDTIYSNRGGTEKQLLRIISSIHHESFLLCLRKSDWLSGNRPPCQSAFLGYEGFLKPNLPFVMAKYLAYLKHWNIDLVQTFFEDSMFVGCLGKILSRRRHALVIGRRDLGLGTDEPAYHRIYQKLRPLGFRVSDGIAVNASAIRDRLAKLDKVPPKKIILIKNGVDLPAAPETVPTLFCEHQADVWIGVVANLKPVKRIDLLLRALSLLRQIGVKERVRAVILGDGNLKSELIQIARDLNIFDITHFIGSVENVSDYLFRVDIGVLCSDKEGLSNAILEYMACGLPVVATDTGGNSEIVDETNGACVPVGDPMALAIALARLIKSPFLRKSLGVQSLRKIGLNHTWQNVIPQWEHFYASIAEKAGIPC